MLTADFASAAVLITFGALLGKTSPLQMVVIAIIEIILFAVNEYIGLEILKVGEKAYYIISFTICTLFIYEPLHLDLRFNELFCLMSTVIVPQLRRVRQHLVLLELITNDPVIQLRLAENKFEICQ